MMSLRSACTPPPQDTEQSLSTIQSVTMQSTGQSQSLHCSCFVRSLGHADPPCAISTVTCRSKFCSPVPQDTSQSPSFSQAETSQSIGQGTTSQGWSSWPYPWHPSPPCSA